MTFSIPLAHRPTPPERLTFKRTVTGNLGRLIAFGFIGVGVLALVSFKAGAGVAGWALGTPDDE